MNPSINTIPLSRSRDVPFNKLVLSQSNVRQIKSGISLDDLREDIAVRGLLQSLNIRPIFGEDGQETGMFEVPAGGRRFRCLEQLVKQKRLAKTALIPCVLRDEKSTTSAEDDSLAENVQREALHPLDQYRAFMTLRRQNMSEEDIAARFFVSVSIVKQRLRLASVSPNLLDLYGDDAMTLEQLMAFSISTDHIRQEQSWAAISQLGQWNQEPYHIRRMLTESTVAASDRRVIFVGVEAYEMAGGAILNDLFQGDNGGWLQDPALLDRLVTDKLTLIAQDLALKGWKWIEIMPNLPFDYASGLRQLKTTQQELTLNADDQAAFNTAMAEYTDLSQEYESYDELPEEIDVRMSELEKVIEDIEGAEQMVFDPEDIKRAGVFLTLTADGQTKTHQGYVRPEDEASLHPQINGEGGTGDDEREILIPNSAIITVGGVQSSDDDKDEDDVIKPLPERLILELTAYRTVALRDAIASHPHTAMTLLLHKLVADTFQYRYGGSCLQVSVMAPSLSSIQPKDLNESGPALAIKERHDLWAQAIPADDEALWQWLDEAHNDVRLRLLAYCISFGINALQERSNPYGAGPSQHTIDMRLKHAMRVAKATNLDLVACNWESTADNYLNRVAKSRILEAVKEGAGERAAQLIEHLKKSDMVKEAERLLAGTGWLPEVLRMTQEIADDALDVDVLPEFLSETDVYNDDRPIAAE